MLDEIITEVREMNLAFDRDVQRELLKKVKICNYIPKPAEDAYIKAIFSAYCKSE